MLAIDASDRLIADKLRLELGEALIGREIVVLEKTTSTNDAVLRLATTPKEEGLVVFAEHQTAGRGQRGNRWESAPHKGLWFSILLQPKINLAESARLTAWAAQTISQTIESEFCLDTCIKMPNDVYLTGRKVAGVLVEMHAQKKAQHFAIVGIGINVNHTAEDFPKDLRKQATSLALALSRRVDRRVFALTLLRNLDQGYRKLFAA